MMDIRLPNITDSTDSGKLRQMQSYLYQLVQDLNWVLAGSGSGSAATTSNTPTAEKPGSTKSDPVSTFNSVKSLIIKSADIVDAYYDSISRRLEGVYVAQSDFGTFRQETSQDITQNSTSISQLYENIQQIADAVELLDNSIIQTNARINSGLLYYDDSGAPVYGLEIGQRTYKDGVEVFNKYAQFTSDKLAFFDKNENEVAYISDRKLYITDVEITGSLVMGYFKQIVLPDGGTVKKWIGG